MVEITEIEMGMPGPAGRGITAGEWSTIRSDVDDLQAGALIESAEMGSTPVAGGSTDAPGADIRRYAFFQLPTTEKLYIITGIEWKNGATIDGNVYCGVEIVDADPPVATETALVAWAKRAHSGISSLQRLTRLTSLPIRGGTRLGVWFNTDSATATFAYTTGASDKNNRNATATDEPRLVLSGGWGSSPNYYYVKAYWRAYE